MAVSSLFTRFFVIELVFRECSFSSKVASMSSIRFYEYADILRKYVDLFIILGLLKSVYSIKQIFERISLSLDKFNDILKLIE